jgi:iron complex outermembrane receptor protein
MDGATSTFVVALQPATSTVNLFSTFVQDEIAILNQLRLTIGSKFEHNTYTGLEVQPNARLLWSVDKRQSLWFAVSRAVRTPSRAEENVRINVAVVPPEPPPLAGPVPAVVSMFGSPQYKSENLMAYEWGYRIQPTKSLSADFAAFFNHYDNLRSVEPGLPFVEPSPAPVHLVVPYYAGNKLAGNTKGVELLADWRIIRGLGVSGNYSFFTMDVKPRPDSLDTTSISINGQDPHHQFYLRTFADLPGKFQPDLIVRHVSSLSSLNLPSYNSFDGHLTWKLRPDLSATFGSENLLNKRHVEFVPEYISTVPTAVGRSIYGSLSWSFGSRQ